MLRLPYKILKYKLVILRPPYKIVVCREKSELSLGCIMKDGTGGFSGGHVSGAPFAESGCLGTWCRNCPEDCNEIPEVVSNRSHVLYEQKMWVV